MNHKNYEGLPLFRDMKKAVFGKYFSLPAAISGISKKAIIFMRKMKSSAA